MTTTLCLGLDAHRVHAAICEQHADRQQLITWHALDLDKPLLPERNMPSTTDPALAAVDTVLDHVGSLVGAEIRRPGPNSEPRTVPGAWRMDCLYLTLDPLPPLRVWLCALTPVWQEPAETVVQSAAGHLLGTTLISDTVRPLEFVHDLEQAAPDLVLCCGGYDIATEMQPNLIRMAQLLGVVLTELGPSFTLILFAGNRRAGAAFTRVVQDASPRTPVTEADSPIRFDAAAPAGSVHKALVQVRSRDARALRLKDILMRRLTPAASPHTYASNFARLCQLTLTATGQPCPVRNVWHGVDQRFDLLHPSANPGDWRPVWSPGPGPAPATLGWPKPWIESGTAPLRRVPELAPIRDERGLLPVLAPLIESDPGGSWPMLEREFGMPPPS